MNVSVRELIRRVFEIHSLEEENVEEKAIVELLCDGIANDETIHPWVIGKIQETLGVLMDQEFLSMPPRDQTPQKLIESITRLIDRIDSSLASLGGPGSDDKVDIVSGHCWVTRHSNANPNSRPLVRLQLQGTCRSRNHCLYISENVRERLNCLSNSGFVQQRWSQLLSSPIGCRGVLFNRFMALFTLPPSLVEVGEIKVETPLSVFESKHVQEQESDLAMSIIPNSNTDSNSNDETCVFTEVRDGIKYNCTCKMSDLLRVSTALDLQMTWFAHVSGWID